jgi:hypothetical protein
MADSGAGPIASCGDGVAGHAPVAHFGDPEIAFDGSTSDQPAHDVYDASGAGGGIDGGAISGEGRGVCREVQPARAPRVRG